MIRMSSAKIITFVGMPGAGKSYCVKFLEQAGLPSVYFGGITLDELKARSLDINEKNEKIVREAIRAQEGKDAYAKRMIQKIEDLIDKGHQEIVVDGLYSWSEYKIFKQKFGDQAIIIAVAAPRYLRHQRLASRPERPLSEDEVSAREYAEIENLEKGGPIANADYTILNDNAPEKMLNQLKSTLKSNNISLQ